MKGCDICGSTKHTSIHISEGFKDAQVLCPACAAHETLTLAAEKHLLAQLKPTVEAWARHWAAAGVRPDALRVSLEFITDYWDINGQLGNPEGTPGLIASATKRNLKFGKTG